MRPIIYSFLIVAGAVPAISQVTPPQKRMETLDLARTLLTTEPVQVDPEEASYKNPFDPRKPLEKAEPEAAPVVAIVNHSDREVLSAAAQSISPSGTIEVGGTPILLFGQKKLKVGDRIPIVFKGETYELEVSRIERTSYTLRFNKEEITRPIKP